jgi:cytochrome c oxidase assembly protein subunit 15
MNGRFFPEDGFALSPWWLNPFENPALAQFDHRMTAYAVAALVALVYARAIRLGKGWPKNSGKAATVLVVVQIFLGIVTLLFQAPPWLAALHQVTAALIFAAAVWHAHELARVRPAA